jgi:hypothetical protein
MTTHLGSEMSSFENTLVKEINLSNMNILYITNRTDKPMKATISDNYTGNNVLSYELLPGANELAFSSLQTGAYTICLRDANNDIFYTQKLIKD